MLGLVLSGGGSKGLLHLGALQFLEEQKILREIKFISGASIGACIGLLICCGFSILDIYKFLYKINIPTITNILYDYSHIIDDYGILDISNIFDDIVTKNIINKFGYVPTMKQLFIFSGVELNIHTVNLSKNKTVVINYDTYPDMLCNDAVEASSLLPFIFKKKNINGDLYIDGGFSNNLPIESILYKCDKLYVLNIKNEDPQLENVKDYIINILMFIFRKTQSDKNKKILEDYKNKIKYVEFIEDDYNFLQLELSEDYKSQLFMKGYNKLLS